MDLRRDEPLPRVRRAVRARRAGPVVTRTAGDCTARLEVLLEQVHVSLDLAEACVDRLRSLPRGPVNVRLPKVLKAEGDLYTATENPLGFNGYYLVSRGEKTPWRLKAPLGSRSTTSRCWGRPSRQPHLRHGRDLGSMFFVVGDIDK